jgi:hypothetical protein
VQAFEPRHHHAAILAGRRLGNADQLPGYLDFRAFGAAAGIDRFAMF